MICDSRTLIGRVAWKQDDLVEARALLTESLAGVWDISDLGLMVKVLYTLATVDADRSQLERAVRMHAAAMELEVVMGAEVWPATRRERERGLAWLKTHSAKQSLLTPGQRGAQ